MIPMEAREVAVAIGASEVSWDKGARITGVSTDSRQVRPGDLFVAIQGDRFDGHDFVAQACDKGAVACICRADRCPAVAAGAGMLVLPVDDTVEALGRLASYYRRQVMSPGTVVVAVTGSNGKTTTKQMLDHVLGKAFRGIASPKSFNNNIGVPLTLLSAGADDRYVITEIGTNAWGEVAALGAMASPDVAVITSIGEAHLEGLGDIRAIAAEKASLLESVREHGFAVVNVDRPEIQPFLLTGRRLRLVTVGRSSKARLPVRDVNVSLCGTTCYVGDRFRFELAVPGAHHACNAAIAFAVARWFGLAPEEIIEHLRTFEPGDGRARPIQCGDVTMIDDAYNANPSSMLAAIQTLRSSEPARRILVMGDMLELGRQGASHHRRMIAAVVDAGIEVLLAVGPLSMEAARAVEHASCTTHIVPCEDAAAASKALASIVGGGDVVWIKGSRAMELDRVVASLRERLARAAEAGKTAVRPPRRVAADCATRSVA